MECIGSIFFFFFDVVSFFFFSSFCVEVGRSNHQCTFLLQEDATGCLHGWTCLQVSRDGIDDALLIFFVLFFFWIVPAVLKENARSAIIVLFLCFVLVFFLDNI